jgi:hypothetical protein
MPSPELHPTPEQLKSFDFQESLDLFAADLARLEADTQDATGTNKYPEWWGRDNQVDPAVIDRELRETEHVGAELAQYYLLYAQSKEIRERITGFATGGSLNAFYSSFGADKISEALHSEPVDGRLHQDLLIDLAKPGSEACVSPELDILQTMYGLESKTDLLAVKGDGFDNQVHDALRNTNAIRWIRYSDEPRQDVAAFELEKQRLSAKESITKAITTVSELSEQEAANYAHTAALNDQNTNYLSIIETVEYFGADRLRRITDFTGIHGLECYTIDQLARMERLIDDPANVAEELSDKDVTVVMVNRVGDYNGAMQEAAADFESNDNSTLFFEIRSLAEVYRYVSKLKRAGIKPTTLVLSAHSNKGQFMVTDLRPNEDKTREIAHVAGRSMVNMVNTSGIGDPNDYGYAIDGMKGMSRLVDEYMKPSKLDSRRKIIFNACYMGSEVMARDIDANGDRVEVGEDSVISRLGKDLLKSGTVSAVDVYGADGGIKIHRSKNGVRYSGGPNTWLGDRSDLSATRIRLEKGTVKRENIDEIVLR